MEDYIAFSCSRQGYNHIKIDKVGQDASGCDTFDDVAVIAVADGHGSDNYPRTDRGSRYAVSSALGATKEFVKTVRASEIDLEADSEGYLEQLAKSILASWHDQVNQDVDCDPFTAEDLAGVSEKYQRRYLSGEYNAKAYGTTLIMACMTRDFWFGIQIGDGKCVTIGMDGTAAEPIPWDENCQQNITTSLCDSDAINEFRYYYSKERPTAVFLGSDGVDDSYVSPEDLHDLYRAIMTIFAGKGADVGERTVDEYLPGISQRGSGDDISVAGIISTECDQKWARRMSLQMEYLRANKQIEESSQFLTAVQDRLTYYDAELERSRREQERILALKEKTLREKTQKEQELEDARQRIEDIKRRLGEPDEITDSEETEPSDAQTMNAGETEQPDEQAESGGEAPSEMDSPTQADAGEAEEL